VRSVQQLRDPVYLKRIVSGSVRTANSFRLDHPPSQLWPFVSNTDMINRRTGLPAVTYTFQKNPLGGTFAHGVIRLGPWALGYEELPFEWRAPHLLSSDRVFQNGPLTLMRYEVELSPTAEGGTEVQSSLTIGPRFLAAIARPAIRRILRRFEKVYREIDSRLGSAASATPAAGFLEDGAQVRARARALAEEWKGLLPDSRVPVLVADFIASAPDRFLRRIRPFELAAEHSVNRLAMLKFFLLATRAGFLNMSWDILCPSCGGDKSKSPSLGELSATAHCEACDIDYSAGFDRNVEVTFSPTAKVRSIGTGLFCLNPANATHVVAQHTVDPGQDSKLTLDLAEGRYRLRSATVEGRILFEVAEGGASVSRLEADLAGDLSSQGVTTVAPRVDLQIANPKTYAQTVRIENLWWLKNAATAAFVTSLQDFRDLFSSEALSPGIQLGISNLAVMFTDLKGSTSLYDTFGDAKAFSLVQSHFDILHRVIASHTGGIVKTIGDAVMAVFQTAENALEAGLSILKEFDQWNSQHDAQDQITIKLGFFEGPCIALTLNDKLDYFGSTVNRASRLEGQSHGGDLVLPESVFRGAPVQRVLQREAARGIRVLSEQFEATLKGFSEKQVFCRLRIGE
jgi:adenylate cyclase